MKIKIYIMAILSVLLISGCVQKKLELNPLEIQSMQTKEFENNIGVVFPSVMSVFQDLGYTIKSADKVTGFISASGTAKSDKGYAFWTGVTKVNQTVATAFIEKIGKITKVRLSFVTETKKSGAWGQTNKEDEQVLNAKVYQNAFEKISNAIFVRASSS